MRRVFNVLPAQASNIVERVRNISHFAPDNENSFTAEQNDLLVDQLDTGHSQEMPERIQGEVINMFLPEALIPAPEIARVVRYLDQHEAAGLDENSD